MRPWEQGAHQPGKGSPLLKLTNNLSIVERKPRRGQNGHCYLWQWSQSVDQETNILPTAERIGGEKLPLHLRRRPPAPSREPAGAVHQVRVLVEGVSYRYVKV